MEKEWRRKEREEAIKKIKENEELKEARRKQIEDQRESYAYEIQREKEQFDKIIKHNIEDMEKTKEMERLKKEVSFINQKRCVFRRDSLIKI